MTKTAQDLEKEYILEIINRAGHPIKAGEIQQLGGMHLKELTKNSRIESGSADPSDPQKTKELYRRQINRIGFQLCASSLLKEKDSKTDQGLTGTFISINANYVPSSSTSSPPPSSSTPKKSSTTIKPSVKISDSSDITDEMITSSYKAIQTGDPQDPLYVSSLSQNVNQDVANALSQNATKASETRSRIINNLGLKQTSSSISIVATATNDFISRYSSSASPTSSPFTVSEQDIVDAFNNYGTKSNFSTEEVRVKAQGWGVTQFTNITDKILLDKNVVGSTENRAIITQAIENFKNNTSSSKDLTDASQITDQDIVDAYNSSGNRTTLSMETIRAKAKTWSNITIDSVVEKIISDKGIDSTVRNIKIIHRTIDNFANDLSSSNTGGLVLTDHTEITDQMIMNATIDEFNLSASANTNSVKQVLLQDQMHDIPIINMIILSNDIANTKPNAKIILTAIDLFAGRVTSEAPTSPVFSDTSFPVSITKPKDISDSMIETAFKDNWNFEPLSWTKKQYAATIMSNDHLYSDILKSIFKLYKYRKTQKNTDIIASAIIEYASHAIEFGDILSVISIIDPSINTQPKASKYIIDLSNNDQPAFETLLHKLLKFTSFPQTQSNNFSASFAIGRLAISSMKPSPSSSTSQTTLSQPPTPASVITIDPRIKVTNDFMTKHQNNTLSSAGKNTLYEITTLIPHLDSLVQHLQSSKDYYELHHLLSEFTQNNQLSLNDWKLIQAHKSTGTTQPISPTNLPIFQKLKLVINRLDKIPNTNERAQLIKLFNNFPLTDSVSHSQISIIDSNFARLSNLPTSPLPSKDLLSKKLSLLNTLPLSDSEKRIVTQSETLLNADKLSIPNELIIDNILRSHTSDIPPEILEYSPSHISFAPIISLQEKHLRKIASHISIDSSSRISSQIREVFTFQDEDIEKLHTQLLSQRDTEVDEALIYIFHSDLIDPIVLKLINNLLKK
jgi:hypothetical protein